MMRSKLLMVVLFKLLFIPLSAQADNVRRSIFLPNEILLNTFTVDERLILAGFVSNIEIQESGFGVSLDVTDGHATVLVKYNGLLPDLMTTGMPGVFIGSVQSGMFVASTILLISREWCAKNLPPEAQAELVSLGFHECSFAGS